MIKVYVGTYGKYAAGSIKGEWIDITEMDKDTYLETARKLHADERDPELMIQDTDIDDQHSMLSPLISEYGINEKFWSIKDYLEENNIDLSAPSDLMQVHNDMCDEFNHFDSHIYDDYFTLIPDNDSTAAFNLGRHSSFSPSDNYFRLNGYGHIESTWNLSNWIDENLISEYLTQKS